MNATDHNAPVWPVSVMTLVILSPSISKSLDVLSLGAVASIVPSKETSMSLIYSFGEQRLPRKRIYGMVSQRLGTTLLLCCPLKLQQHKIFFGTNETAETSS